MIRASCAFCVALAAASWVQAESLGRKEFSRTVVAVQLAFSEHDFKRLEAIHAEVLDQRLDDGTWMLEAFEYAFDPLFRSGRVADKEKSFSRWKASMPQSRLRPIAEAYLWFQRASLALDAGCAAVDASGRPLAARLLDRAEEALRDADPAASPLHGSIALRVAGAQGRSTEALDALLVSATARAPAFLPAYWSRGRFMLPPWARDFDAFDRFARERVPGGDTGYALIYATVARDTCHEVLGESDVSWDRMRDGLMSLARERDTPWNWNLLGTFACRFRDHEVTAEVLARLGSNARLDVWTSGQSTASCKLMIRPPVVRGQDA